ncbi:hypothetical protein N7540_001048 [Penicillium herquei]|nr:hypothetical protein N7540_001048 [Penicillium herquei]
MGLEIPEGTPNRGPGARALFIILMILTTLMTLVRVASKIITKQRWWWDDFFALLSWAAEVTLLGILIAWVHFGLGLHEAFVAVQNSAYLIHGAKLFYVGVFIFDTSICLPKISALFFYARVFNAKNRSLRIQLWILGGLVAAWLLAAYLVSIWQCDPIARAWNTSIPGKCVNKFAWYTATATISCVIDIWILVIPIPLIMRLNTSLRRRIYLLVAFCLTYSVIIISIGRMGATIQIIPHVEEDITWSLTTYMYWVTLEGSFSIISISVPNGIALVKHLRGHTKRPSENASNSKASEQQYEFNSRQNYSSVYGGKASISGNSDSQELCSAAANYDGTERTPGNIHVQDRAGFV